MNQIINGYSKSSNDAIYDKVKATGIINLGITDEKAKASLIKEYAKKNFSKMKLPILGIQWAIAGE